MRSYQFTNRYRLISRTDIQQMIMLYRIKNIIKVYIIKKHNPIHTSKFKYLYYFSCILNIIHSPDSKAIEIQKQNIDGILLTYRGQNIRIIWIYKRRYTQKWLKRSKIPLITYLRVQIIILCVFESNYPFLRKNLKQRFLPKSNSKIHNS